MMRFLESKVRILDLKKQKYCRSVAKVCSISITAGVKYKTQKILCLTKRLYNYIPYLDIWHLTWKT